MSPELFQDQSTFLSARVLQLRRETIAAMRLRTTKASTSRVHRNATEREPHLMIPGRSSGLKTAWSWKFADERVTRILSISDYDGLRLSREQLLRREGYYVESVLSTACLDVGWVRSFDVGILCQSVEIERAIRLAELLRRYNPSILLLRVHPYRVRRDVHAYFDLDVEGIAGPKGFLEAIERLEQKSAGEKRP